MRKPASLRAALALMLPYLARDPDRLRMWVETGKVLQTGTPSRNFVWQYTLNVLVTECTLDPAVLAVLINDWLATQQPDALNAQAGYPFEADILDGETSDVQFTLPLTEPVLVSPRIGGGWDIDYPGEPDPLFPADEPLAPGGSTLQSIWSGGHQLVPELQGAPDPGPVSDGGVLDFTDPANSALLVLLGMTARSGTTPTPDPGLVPGVLDFSNPANSGLLIPLIGVN